jgi:hypothetical protein
MLTMTSQARAISAFSLSILVLLGPLNRLALAVYLLFGGNMPAGQGSQFVLSLLTVVVAVGALWFAHVAAQAGDPGWETNLAQAARLMALLGVVMAAVATIAVLTNSSDAIFGSFSLTF